MRTWPVFLTLLLSASALAADRVLATLDDGTVVEGELLDENDAQYVLRLPDGTAMILEKADVSRIEIRSDAAPSQAPPPPPAAPVEPPPTTTPPPPPPPSEPEPEPEPEPDYAPSREWGIGVSNFFGARGGLFRLAADDVISWEELALNGAAPAFAFDIARLEFRFFLDDSESIDVQFDLLDAVVTPAFGRGQGAPWAVDLVGMWHGRWALSRTVEAALGAGQGVRVDNLPGAGWMVYLPEVGRAGFDFQTRNQALDIGLYLRAEIASAFGTRWGFDLVGAGGVELTVLWNKTRMY